jgi:hypothetical protein
MRINASQAHWDFTPNECVIALWISNNVFILCHACAPKCYQRVEEAMSDKLKLDDLQADVLKLRFILRQAKHVCGSIPVGVAPSDELLRQAFDTVIAAERALAGSEQ